MTAMTGGCACGAVRYRYTAAPQLSLLCCCRQCQYATGTGHTTLFVAAKDSLSLEGELTFHARASASGNRVEGGFCPTCGSPVMSVNSGYPDVRYIHVGTLDDPSVFTPELVVWHSESGNPGITSIPM